MIFSFQKNSIVATKASRASVDQCQLLSDTVEKGLALIGEQ
jgi:hypothetical protein